MIPGSSHVVVVIYKWIRHGFGWRLSGQLAHDSKQCKSSQHSVLWMAVITLITIFVCTLTPRSKNRLPAVLSHKSSWDIIVTSSCSATHENVAVGTPVTPVPLVFPTVCRQLFHGIISNYMFSKERVL
jgi:hypothetical protein